MKKSDHSRFIVCRAAAGSGKTYTLVRQYIELAFDASEGELPTRFSHILAITFTNKAANEMKARILKELDRMATKDIDDKDNQMGKDIAGRLNMDPTTLKKHASIVRQAILHNYSDLSVCTIDSFMHRIVKTFAHDLNLPMNFDVQIDENALIENAVDNLMGLAGADGQEELTEVLCEFAQHQMDEDKSYMIEADLAKLAKELFKEQTPEYLASLRHISPSQFRAMHHQMMEANRQYEKKMKDFGQQGLNIMREHQLEAEDFYQARKGVFGYFTKLAGGNFAAPGSHAVNFLEGDKLGSSKSSAETLDRLSSAKPQLVALHHSIETYRTSDEKPYNTRRLLLKNLYSLAVLNQLNELVAAYSKENDIVHISEFNKRIAEVVESEPMPFIYERIGTHYYNYLIDEFQDTSRMQWLNLVPLLANGVSSGHTSLVVGDGKQAIYRFRKGDVEQFLALPHVDNSFHGDLLENPDIAVSDRLGTNFRTCETVVQFNNDFFEWVLRNRFSNHAELQEIYITPKHTADEPEQKRPDLAQDFKKKGGYVQIGFWELEKGENKFEPMWEQMLHDIRCQVEEKKYLYKDITLLARNKKTLNEISAYLTAHGIPVVSSESFLISQSRTVMLLRNLFQYLIDGNDRVAAMRVALYMHSLGLLKVYDWDAEICRTDEEGRPLSHLLERLLRTEHIDLNCERLRSLGLYDGCEEAIRMLGLSEIESAYTATLLNAMARYSNSHRQDWKEFLDWFDDQKENISTSTSDDLDAVRLMTIHKSKGLEAPIIMYPVIKPASHPLSLWVHIDQQESGIPLPASLIQSSAKESTLFDNLFSEEELKQAMDDLNVLYVALTRPKEKLLLYCQAASNNDMTSYSALLRGYLDDKNEPLSDDGKWCCGDDSEKKAGNEESRKESPVSLHTISYPDWSGRIKIAQQAQALLGQFDDSAKQWGNHMHAILSLMQNTDDCDSAIRRYLESNPNETLDINQMAQQLHLMMKQPDVARFFDAGCRCKNEASLVWHGEVLRPDRIVMTDSETWVVDFKTGMPSLQHHKQVEDYCEAIRSMGYEQVKGFLLYIGPSGCQVVTVNTN